MTILTEACARRFAKAALVAFSSPSLRLEGEIAGAIRPYLSSARLKRRFRADDMRQRLPIDRDGLSGIPRRGKAIGHDEGNRVADVADHLVFEDRYGGTDDVGADHPGVGNGARSATSGAVKTSRTPGIARTAARSPNENRACACDERTTTAWSEPAGA